MKPGWHIGMPPSPGIVGLQHAAGPLGELLDQCRRRVEPEHRVRAEACGQLRLGVEAGDHADLHVGVQRAQDRDRRSSPSAPAPHTSTRPPGGGGWRVTLCSDTANGSAKIACSSSMPSGTANSIDECAGINSAYPPVASLDTPVWMPGADVARGEAPAEAEVAGRAGRADRRDAAGRARQPRVEHDPVADVEPRGLRPGIVHHADHLVAEHLGERAEPAHGAVAVALEVQQHLLRVGAADAGEQRPHDVPVGPQRAGVGHVDQRAGRGRQVPHQPVGLGWRRERLGRRAEHQCLHGSPVVAWSGRSATTPRSSLTPVSHPGGRSRPVTVGIDIGTTSVKAVAVGSATGGCWPGRGCRTRCAARCPARSSTTSTRRGGPTWSPRSARWPPGLDVVAVNVSAMVPSLGAVDADGPRLLARTALRRPPWVDRDERPCRGRRQR